ncbi:UDP-N-acetylglucosamine 2-epimerase [Tenuibacillus multivorans]|uniref:UDP-N-acetylglucosamine 2-epimerase n=1 Tax=Tenuibacillus multivorans TaxID=237069 RepID=A0A1G9YQ44_9BACI|nr:UDP-N-acetylglucosamine 2-epimerase [Tenuibacillus multivorans]GEL78488.1 hypothetical protein TMU01_27230 [Tenuibacillus multivorans]SDN10705.1 UDP-N-acetylglucosamine 2-epimerase [Tenuibacillus multivorans]
MNTYERNYWSLYVDFLTRFKSLTYQDYPIPIFSYFYERIKNIPKIQQQLKNESFLNNLEETIDYPTEIQEKFNSFIKPEPIEATDGIVVFHEPLLRLTPQALKRNFSGLDILLLRQKGRLKGAVPVDALNRYSTASHDLINQIKEDSYHLFSLHQKHPVYGQKAFQRALIQEIPIILNQIVAVEDFLSQHHVSCLVLGSTNQIENRVLAMVGRQKGIPSIGLQHGVVASEFGYLPKLSTIQAVYGQYEVDWFKQKGVNEAEIKKIGHPRYDNMCNKNLSKKEINKKLKIKHPRKSILIISHHEKFQNMRLIIAELSKLTSYNLIIRPRGRSQELKTIIRDFPQVYVSTNVPLIELLHNADLVVSYESTVVLEALILNKPVFVWKNEYDSLTDYFEQLGDYYDQTEQIVQRVMQFIKDPSNQSFRRFRDRFLNEHYKLPLNQAGKRLKQLVQSYQGHC